MTDGASHEVDSLGQVWLRVDQQGSHVLAHHDHLVGLAQRTAQRPTSTELVSIERAIGVAQHTSPPGDRHQAALPEPFPAAAMITPPAELAETGHVVVMDIPDERTTVRNGGHSPNHKRVKHVVEVDDVRVEHPDQPHQLRSRLSKRFTRREPLHDVHRVQLDRHVGAEVPAHEMGAHTTATQLRRDQRDVLLGPAETATLLVHVHDRTKRELARRCRRPLGA